MDALHMAAVLEILHPSQDGRTWTALCCWCLNDADPQERHPARRVGGDCLRCNYTGPDTFVAYLPPRDARREREATT